MNQTLDPHAQQNGHTADAEQIPAGVPVAGDAPKLPGVRVDLARWGRGEIEYPFSEVQKAIDDYAMAEIEKVIAARFDGIVDRAAAVDFLVEEGIIKPEEARTDV
jgi:hypothetical protein